MSAIDFDFQSMTGYLPGSKAVVSVSGASQPAAKATNPPPPDDLLGSEQWAYWGTNNNFPNDVINLVSKSTVAPQALQFKIKSIYGKGVIPCHVELDDEGNEKILPIKDEEVKKFFRENNIRKFMLEQITDYVWFANCFPEIILNKRRDKIVNMYPNESAYSRWELINEKSRKIENCYFSANWPNPLASQVVKVPALDPYDPVNALREGNKFKYVLNVSLPSPGKSYYQLPAWDGARSNGWLEVANEIPRFKRAMFQNQMTIKWHIKIPKNHFEDKFSKMNPAPSEDEKKKIIMEDLKKMDDFLTGSENAAKSFVSFYAEDKITGKELPGWQLIALDDKLKDGKWLPDSSAANSEILFAMGVDPSIMGAGMPGGPYTQGNGGSNKRESYLINTALLQPERDALIEPLYLVKQVNRWSDTVDFRFIDSILTTLDKGKGTEKVLS